MGAIAAGHVRDRGVIAGDGGGTAGGPDGGVFKRMDCLPASSESRSCPATAKVPGSFLLGVYAAEVGGYGQTL